ncbi:MAG: hypothetical protein II877_12820 [Synergistaceae bacterium]|nr:hypothetical protein [Synergistaceae bacterium]
MLPAYLALVLFVAGLGAFTDICSGHVRNIHLIAALMLWLALAVSEALFLHTSSADIFPPALNVILPAITAIIFYLSDIWAPGDCKLYTVISLIFPARAYVVREGNIFPAIDFAVYAFALGYIFLLTMTLSRRNDSKMISRPNFSIKHCVSILSNAGTISAVNIFLNTYAPEFSRSNQVLCILCSVALIFILHKKAVLVAKTIGITGLIYILCKSIFSGSFLNVFAWLAVSLVIASAIECMTSRVRENTYREISGDEVRPGMILSFTSLWAMRKCIDPELPKTTTENRRSRLTQRQAEAVKTWCRNAHSNVVIVEMMPFAPFIAGAVVIQILRFLLLGSAEGIY